jgi:hypothetical protein
MSDQPNILPFWRRVFHVFQTDLRRERIGLFAWMVLLLVLVSYGETSGETSRGFAMVMEVLGLMIGIGGLGLVVKVIRADAPNSSATASLTRPIGREALWLAKVLFVLTLLWLPYMSAMAFTWRDYGLDAAAWRGVLAVTARSSLLALFFAGWGTVCWTKRKRSGSWFGSLGFLMALILLSLLIPGFTALLKMVSIPLEVMVEDERTGLLRCQVMVASVLLVLTLVWAWFLESLGRRSESWVYALATASLLTGSLWTWDWQQVPPQVYQDAQLELKFTGKREDGEQTLWPNLQLKGLPEYQIATVAALAPILDDGEPWSRSDSYSDFTLRGGDGRVGLNSVWLKFDHTFRLSEHFPEHLIWVGQQGSLRTELKDILGAEASAHRWRIRLLIHEWKPLTLGTLQTVGEKGRRWVAPGLGRVSVDRVETYEDTALVRAALQQRLTSFRFGPKPQPFYFHQWRPTQNYLMTVQHPDLDEMIVPRWTDHGAISTYVDFWNVISKQSLEAYIPLPVIHRDVTGLDMGDWMKGAVVTIWVPEERGVIDFELSTGDLERLSADVPLSK